MSPLAPIGAFCGLALLIMIALSRPEDDSLEAHYANCPAPARAHRPPPESYPVAAPVCLPDGVRPVLEMLPIEQFFDSHYGREGVLPSGHLVQTGHNGGIDGPLFYVQVAGKSYGAESWEELQAIVARLVPGLTVTWPLTREQAEFEEAIRVGRVGMGRLDPRVPDKWKWGW